MQLATFVLGSIPLLIQLYARKYLEEDKVKTMAELQKDLNLPRIKEYDFIVVGGGSAGCIIAGRLSEQFNVLLLEAGGEPVPASQVPYFVNDMAADPDTNYHWSSVPQRLVSKDTGGVIYSHLGKLLGGSGSHNHMVHNRGNPKDYDNYARIANDSSWRYENVLEYFKKYENFIGKRFTREYEGNYGHNGSIVVDTDTPPFLPIWFDVAKELGYKIADPNGYQSESFSPTAKAINKGRRSNSYSTYIKPVKDSRQNLTVHPYSMATQVLIDSNKKAYGVVYERHGIPQIAHASKEIIISSGVYSSPLLLMKSGVGPRDQLEEAGIPVKHDLPALGQNLADHLMLNLGDIQYNSSIIPYIPRMPVGEKFEEMIQKYQETGEGILGDLPVGPQAFIVSSRAKKEGEGDWPDLHIIYDPRCHTKEGDELPVSCFFIFLARPKFRGSLRLNTTAYKKGERRDDVKLALIDYKIFEGESISDLDVLAEGIQFMLNVFNSTTMQKYGTVYRGEPHPACGAQEFLSTEYWKCVITRKVVSGYHATGTCSLGAVVDSKFRVHGISNLRVADGSVFPAVPNSNLNAPVMMLAEKAVADIIQAWV
ncbi:unnamed protein product [Orchesella dallaii]|uniref:Oxygen-dependent choline dehydrogenase n=1 Tax=Orchesella dallaii TaxID=48710 RepID=A0ABP1RLV2_9HEXA